MKNGHGLDLIEFFVIEEIFRQIALITKLQEDIEIRFGLFDINKIDDMLMFAMIEHIDLSFKDTDLIICNITKLITFDIIPGYDFDSNFSGVIGIGKIDLWEWSLT